MTDTKFDEVMGALIDYAYSQSSFNEDTLGMARFCLMDSIGCAIAASEDRDCMKLLGSAQLSKNDQGVPVIGTSIQLGPIEASFHIGSMVRWLEFNDTWLAQEWGHPSDNLGAILAAAAWQNLQRDDVNPINMADVLNMIVRAYEIHGILCLENCFNALGIDHVVLVKIASTIAASKLLNLPKEQALSALSNAVIDGHPLRTYRHAPNAGTRKSWAAGDATARGIQLALFAQTGEMGYPTALTTKRWGFNDAVLRGNALTLPRDLSDFVIRNILFKVPNPAEYHAQTAVEAAIRLRERIEAVGSSIAQIEYIRVETTRPAIQIIDKSGTLNNSADRDHCLQYMIAVALCTGDLTINDFHEPMASDPQIHSLRDKINCIERISFTESYYDPEKRAIPNALHLKCTGMAEEISEVIEYPLGHVRRRNDCFPALIKKFRKNVSGSSVNVKSDELVDIMTTATKLDDMSIIDFLHLFSIRNI
ncbi:MULTISPECIES: bifunctional 2-methylcitrate dehydratase/aconitate hydratase [Acidithiobacillus]|uniref:2-methylcitrate dehydratase n=1 Tax=Acidithiobacillus thiooxidans ATCC 19377 TaxID=637390 RepID=A0A5P9XQB8_ACITH|nr:MULTISPECIES: bifunctional 2-methylcitrate dehydratase/aconitate hydratase [Acidithiobacillus]MDA8154754.1 bifunctional 2-methylcitrate dehydratase/aconitate hydratase [Acidithiobacillus sp.]MDD5278040.1 bifunctional 2-methylcitrate dehydratase/aconitate hydratase [Acidithiobacillus sp.]QFX96052.1 2-methylcitrate dehydratase [Acidithiobacillus thiooxidans ATCC 19377]